MESGNIPKLRTISIFSNPTHDALERIAARGGRLPA